MDPRDILAIQADHAQQEESRAPAVAHTVSHHEWQTAGSSHNGERGRIPIGPTLHTIHRIGARARSAQRVGEGALVSALPQAHVRPLQFLPPDRRDCYRMVGAWPPWVRRT